MGCSGCGTFGMCSVGCGMFAGMLDVDLQNSKIAIVSNITVIFIFNKKYFRGTSFLQI